MNDPLEEKLSQAAEDATKERVRSFFCGSAPSRKLSSASGFTLVELIVVMAVLAVVLALSAPSLARSMRQRNLDAEAVRFLAATEYGRDEAVSQGVPMTLWIDEKAQRFGVEPKSGFLGDETRSREFTLHPDVQIELEKTVTKDDKVQPIEFSPDGAPALTNVESVQLKDRFNSMVTIARTTDGWGYEILKEAK
jgi:type II secretion system protein H